ncbi:anti-sigma factor family protein [Baekduia sp. Peel2402]|uniref:anti-sigma factor family protein n=1 Tax=Baekduia sp. Peel2402 TaxID=3458296 RepID=UPI00403E838F
MSSVPTPIPCREVVELVTEYVEGTLDAERRVAFEAHLSCCDWCGAYLRQIRITLRVVGDLPPEAVDPAVERGLLDLYRELRKDAEG